MYYSKAMTVKMLRHGLEEGMKIFTTATHSKDLLNMSPESAITPQQENNSLWDCKA